jgi:peptidoglycan biosynthesis protein MviN/MurJ (putative lipid II flippase)
VLTAVYAAVAFENVLANLVLIPLLSLNGAAVGTSLSELLAAGALLWAAWSAGGTPSFARVLAGPALAAAAAAGAMWALDGSLVAAIVGGALVYGATLFAFERLVFPHDAGAIWASLRRSA